MKKITCECGRVVEGATENDVMSKIESHLHNDHPDRAVDHKKMLADAKKTLTDE